MRSLTLLLVTIASTMNATALVMHLLTHRAERAPADTNGDSQ